MEMGVASVGRPADCAGLTPNSKGQTTNAKREIAALRDPSPSSFPNSRRLCEKYCRGTRRSNLLEANEPEKGNHPSSAVAAPI